MNILLTSRTRCLPSGEDRDDPDGLGGDTWIDLPVQPGPAAEPRVRVGEEPAPDWMPL